MEVAALGLALVALLLGVGCRPALPASASEAPQTSEWVAASPRNSSTSALPSSVLSVIEARIASHRYPGLVLGVVDERGLRYYGFGTKGLKDGRAPDEHTVYEIGSVNKVFTGLLLADRVKRGEVSLEDPIERYLPDEARAPRYENHPITLVQLSTHTSGLPRLPDNMAPKDWSNPNADYTRELLLDFLANYELSRAPGEQYEYSNLGSGLLGYFMAQSRGQTFEEMFVERIANVIGLDSTRVNLSPELQARLSIGTSDGVEVSAWDTPTLSGAGGLRSTANDLTRFLAANLAPSSTPLGPAIKMTHESRAEALPGRVDVGLGWHIVKVEDSRFFMHDGGTGGYRSFVGFRFDKHMGVVLLTNSAVDVADIGMHLLEPSLPLTVDGPRPPPRPQKLPGSTASPT